MTEQEIEEGNKQIELHNKFCFMKKQLPYYKRFVPLSEAITYAMLSACLLALPSMLTVTTETICDPKFCSVIQETK